MNLKFSQEDIKFKEEVKDFIMQNLDKNTQKKINNGHHISKDDLVNLMSKSNVSGRGSYNYRGNWDWLDQIIVSQDDFKLISFGAFEEDFMMYTNKKGEVYPNRSFGGNNWYAGFSDHLPVFLRFTF